MILHRLPPLAIPVGRCHHAPQDRRNHAATHPVTTRTPMACILPPQVERHCDGRRRLSSVDVLADTSFDPACPVDEYDDCVDGSGCRTAQAHHARVGVRADAEHAIDARHFIGAAD